MHFHNLLLDLRFQQKKKFMHFHNLLLDLRFQQKKKFMHFHTWTRSQEHIWTRKAKNNKKSPFSGGGFRETKLEVCGAGCGNRKKFPKRLFRGKSQSGKRGPSASVLIQSFVQLVFNSAHPVLKLVHPVLKFVHPVLKLVLHSVHPALKLVFQTVNSTLNSVNLLICACDMIGQMLFNRGDFSV